MFACIYVDALLANEELADQVWELWNAGLIPDELAAIAWINIGMSAFPESGRSDDVNQQVLSGCFRPGADARDD